MTSGDRLIICSCGLYYGRFEIGLGMQVHSFGRDCTCFFCLQVISSITAMGFAKHQTRQYAGDVRGWGE